MPVVKQIIDPAIKEYKALMKKEVLLFKDKDVPCAVKLDESRYLPEFNPNETENSCMGGILLHCKKGRIVCANTLDERLNLCY